MSIRMHESGYWGVWSENQCVATFPSFIAAWNALYVG